MKNFSIFIITGIVISSTFCIGAEYSSELQKAYNWAYENGITTQNSIEKANMKGNITRAELAKMISNYTINILEQEPSTSQECHFNDITNEFDEKYDNGITNACGLGLMGQNIKDFRPNDPVTRAEFGTVLSRALWCDENEGGSTYYENHLKALKSEGIMNKISTPMDKEIRGYVMLMLMRSIDDNAKNQENSDNQISEVIKMLD